MITTMIIIAIIAGIAIALIGEYEIDKTTQYLNSMEKENVSCPTCKIALTPMKMKAGILKENGELYKYSYWLKKENGWQCQECGRLWHIKLNEITGEFEFELDEKLTKQELKSAMYDNLISVHRKK